MEIKWIFVEHWYDDLQKRHYDEYVSEDGKHGKYVDEDGYEEMFDYYD